MNGLFGKRKKNLWSYAARACRHLSDATGTETGETLHASFFHLRFVLFVSCLTIFFFFFFFFTSFFPSDTRILLRHLLMHLKDGFFRLVGVP